MSQVPTTLNMDLSKVSVTEIVIDHDLPTGNYDVEIPDLTVVDRVIAASEVAFVGGNPTITVGDTNTADGFLKNADLPYTTLGACVDSKIVGSDVDPDAPNDYNDGRYYPTGGTLRIAHTQGAGSAGKLVLLVFSRTSLR